jgi:predicted AlkP superfamily phosphohydrolase/phosphomutase
MQWDPDRMGLRRTHPNWIGDLDPFWRNLARMGRKVVAFDVPFSFKGDTGGAIEITNWGSHDLIERFWCGHPEAEKLVLSVAPRHPMEFEVPVGRSRAELGRCLDEVIEGIGLKTEAVLRLMDQIQSELFLVVFGETHRAGHILWPETEQPDSPVPETALLEVYEALDRSVGRILDRAGPETAVVLFSLHGMGPNQSQCHLSAEMLKVALKGAPGEAGFSDSSFGLVRLLRRRVPAPIQRAIAKSVPIAVRDFVLAREVAGGYRWPETPAISLEGDLSGYWRANVKGREAEGMLEDVRAFLDVVAKEFTRFTTEDGTPLVDALHFPAQDWKGKRAYLLPDIVAEWNPELPAVDTAVHPSGKRIAGKRETGRTGNHRFRGFCALRAPCAEEVAMPTHIKDLGALAKSLLRLSGP